jgi:hypothetical protein
MNKLESIIRIVVIGAALTGCASTSTIHFAAASAPPAKVEATFAVPAVEKQAEQLSTEQTGIDALPAEDVALLQPTSAHEFAESFKLTPHVAVAMSFHCTAGEESLGCKAKPVDVDIERDADAIFGL